MPRKRTDVEKIREILRLSCDLKLGIRKIAEALEISKTSVGEYLAEFKRSGLSYPEIIQMGDTEVLEFFEKSNKASNPLYDSLCGEFQVRKGACPGWCNSLPSLGRVQS